MKNILVIQLIILLASNLYSQCKIPDCNTVVQFTEQLPTIGGQSNYNTSICFETHGPWAEISTGSSWNNWEYLSFNSTQNCQLVIQQSINLNGNKEVYFYTNQESSIISNYISFNQSDTVYITGNNVSFNYLISNNTLDVHATRNVILLDSSDGWVYANGQIYHAGDTILSANGTGNKVLVSVCIDNSIPLSINDLQLQSDAWKLFWNTHEIVDIQQLQGHEWITIQYSVQHQYKPNQSGVYRISYQNSYSNIIHFKVITTKPIYYTLDGRQAFHLESNRVYIMIHDGVKRLVVL